MGPDTQIDRPLRAGRAAVFAAACTSVSAAGHVWMSGASIPAFAVLAALLAVGSAGYALARRQRGFASIAGLSPTSVSCSACNSQGGACPGCR